MAIPLMASQDRPRARDLGISPGAGTPGALPLTISMMNTPGGPYDAQPEDVTGRIAPASAASTTPAASADSELTPKPRLWTYS